MRHQPSLMFRKMMEYRQGETGKKGAMELLDSIQLGGRVVLGQMVAME